MAGSVRAWASAVLVAAVAVGCTSPPAPAPPPVPRYVPDPPTVDDYQGGTVEPGAGPTFTDLLYLAGGLEGCPEGSDELCESVFHGTTYRGSHTMDVYEPPEGPDSGRPVIVWMHGGFSVAGDKTGLGDVDYPANLLARQLARGYVVVSLNYRLNVLVDGPDGQQFPTEPVAAQDLDVAVRFIKANAGTLGIDPHRIVLWGHSWGAWAVMMQAVAAGQHTPAWLPASLGAHSPQVAGVVAEAGPSDLPLTVPVALAEVQRDGEFPGVDISALDPAVLAELSPIAHVDPFDSPIYALAGSVDPLVPVADADGMADRYEALGRPDLYRLDVADDAAGAPLPWAWKGHVPHPGANRTELERFIDTVRR